MERFINSRVRIYYTMSRTEDLDQLLARLGPEEYYVESFQQWWVIHGTRYLDFCRGIWKHDVDLINSAFETEYGSVGSEYKGESKVYIVLEKIDRIGRLNSYGSAHMDGERWNLHRIDVLDDYDLLSRFLEVVPVNPKLYLQQLVETIARIGSQDAATERVDHPDDMGREDTRIKYNRGIKRPVPLFTHMKELHILDKGKATEPKIYLLD